MISEIKINGTGKFSCIFTILCKVTYTFKLDKYIHTLVDEQKNINLKKKQ